MEQVLYGPGGYYSSGTAKSGKEGDYFTAPDVGAAFGRLLSEIFQSWKNQLHCDPFTLMEVGAGEGRLAADILSSFRRKPESSALDPGFRRGDSCVRYIAVERSPGRLEALKKLSPVEVLSDLESAPPMEGVLFGNELIDAFPVHRVRMKNGKLEEMYVGAGTRTAPTIQWSSPSTPRLQSYFDRLGITLPEDYETEVNLAMSDWLRQASRVLKRGILLLIDYGRPSHDYYAPERSKGTLRCFSGHQVIDPFAVMPEQAGTQSKNALGHGFRRGDDVDWTSDVDFTSLALDAREAGFTPLAFMEMGTFLMMGVSAVLNSTGGQPAAPTGLRYLLHPEGLGAAFHVLILGKNVDSTKWIFEHNRLRRLGLQGRPAGRPVGQYDDPH